MSSSLQIDYLRLLVSFAWSDGSLAHDEQQAIETLVSDSRALVDEEREEALKLLYHDQAYDDIASQIDALCDSVSKYPILTRTRILRSCMLLCQLGARVIPETTKLHLARLRQRLLLAGRD